MAGLQGTGKTTAAGKLALYLQKKGRKVRGGVRAHVRWWWWLRGGGEMVPGARSLPTHLPPPCLLRCNPSVARLFPIAAHLPRAHRTHAANAPACCQ